MTQTQTAVGKAKPPSAVVPATILTNDEITKRLRELGYLEPETGAGGAQRIKVEGGTFTVGDEMFVSNPKTKAPAFIARIVDVPSEYQGVWLGRDLALAINRPESVESYCKSMFGVEGQDRKFSQSGHDCGRCPIGPFIKKDQLPTGSWLPGTKCKWRGEIGLQILDADGQLTDPTVWYLDMSTTSMMEFKGLSNSPEKGYTGEPNFMHKLAALGMAEEPDEPQKGFLKALSALRVGGVIAEVRSVPQSGGEGGNNKFHLTQFNPIKILDIEVPADTTLQISTGDTDDLPF